MEVLESYLEAEHYWAAHEKLAACCYIYLYLNIIFLLQRTYVTMIEHLKPEKNM